MKLTAAEQEKFDKNIAFMEQMIDVYNWESNIQILGYLTINGRMQAPELAELVGLQGKSVYRSLKKLLNAGLVKKELPDGQQRNAYYYSTNALITDPQFSPDFISYLIELDKYGLIAEYLTAANRSSMGFLQVISNLMEQRIDRSQDPEIGSEFINNTIFKELIFSAADPIRIRDKINTFLKEELRPEMNLEFDPKEKLKSPAAFYLAYVPLTDSDLTDN